VYFGQATEPIDMWDPKPDALGKSRPYQTIDAVVPGIQVCEHR
jgi:hypothetical protein